MTQTHPEAETDDESQILWGLVALILVGMLAIVIVLHIYKLPFPGTLFFAKDKNYPAPTAPVVPGKKHAKPHPAVTPPAVKPSPVTAPSQPSAAPGPSNVPSPVSSPTHVPTHPPARSQGVGVPRSPAPAVPTPSAPKPSSPPILVIPSIIPLPSIGIR